MRTSHTPPSVIARSYASYKQAPPEQELPPHQFAVAVVAREPLSRLVWLSARNVTKLLLCHFANYLNEEAAL
jgi:hypothetical protein